LYSRGRRFSVVEVDAGTLPFFPQQGLMLEHHEHARAGMQAWPHAPSGKPALQIDAAADRKPPVQQVANEFFFLIPVARSVHDDLVDTPSMHC
jgi:hypothetical protein